MTRHRPGPGDGDALRREAEKRLLERGGAREAPVSADAIEGVLHDLRVHQIELEMQNDELRRAQSSLVIERGRYFDLFELAPVGYLTLTSEGVILEANLTAASLIGLSRGEIVGKPFTSFINPDDQDVYYLHRRRVESGAPAETCEVRLVQNGDARRWVSLSTIAAREPDGAPVVRAVVGDITARRKAEEELKQSQARLREAQTLEAVGRLAGGVAHNFNNLLQALLSLSALLRLHSTTPESSRIVDQIDLLLARGASLAQQLLYLSPDQPVTRTAIDLRSLVESATATLRVRLPKNVLLAVEADGAAGSLQVEGDAGQLEQVVMTLALNALDAMPSGGTLSIRVFDRPGFVVLEFEDSGPGIDEATRKHLFEPFIRTSETRGVTVRGLAVAHGIVQSHGGRIDVHGTGGKGNRFRVLLPAAEAPSSVVAGEAAGRELIQGRGERILLVEDEEATREALAEILGLLGYSVRSVGSGQEALDLAPLPVPDLLISDVLLPGIHGPALAERLQELWPGMKVILMSGYTSDVVVPRSAAGEPVRFLRKPFSMAALSRELHAALDSGRDG
jgi:two-component system, cell cycle sensor histidine kinase and response regulator CckA